MNPNRRGFMVGAGLAVAGVGVDVLLGGCSNPSQAPEPQPTDSQVPTPSQIERTSEIGFAMADTLFGKSDQEIEHRLWVAKSLGGTVVRVDFDGWVSQPNGTGEYDWSESDRIVAAIRKAGLGILGTLGFVPPDARKSQDYSGRPKDPALFVPFVGAAAAQFAEDVEWWHIWNEANVSPDGADPVSYVNLFNPSQAAIRKVRKDAVVGLSSLAPSATGGGAMSPADFLDAVFTAGIEGVDAVCVNAYSNPILPEQADPLNAFTQIEGAPGVTLDRTIYSVMAGHEHSKMDVWLTEVGANTEGENSVSLDAQAKTITQALTYQFRFANVTQRHVYTLVDRPDTPDQPIDPRSHYGLYDTDWRAKPAAPAFYHAAKAA